MMRVKSDKIRIYGGNEKFWVLDGTTNEMRHYIELCLKKPNYIF